MGRSVNSVPPAFPGPCGPCREVAEKGARAAGTPFISFFPAGRILALARDCAFKEPRTVSAEDHLRRYFAGRPDDLRPAGSEEMLVATT